MAASSAKASGLAFGLWRSVKGMMPVAGRTSSEEQRAAVALIKDFAAFVERDCRCDATSNRAIVRRAVFQVGEHLDVDRFVAEYLNGDASSVEAVSRMDCPVTMARRKVPQLKVPESAPLRIVYASKALRKHLEMPETSTCRGCLKRERCRFFKEPTEEAATVKHLSRVLFGMAQYARAHLQMPAEYPLYFTPEELSAARTLMSGLARFLQEAGEQTYFEIELADDQTRRTVLTRMFNKRKVKKQLLLEEKALSLPQWMRESLQPVPGPGMMRRQRELLAAGAKLDGKQDNKPQALPAEAAASDVAREGDWIEEGAKLGEFAGPVMLDPVPLAGRQTSPRAGLPGEDPHTEIVSVDAPDGLDAPQRFQHTAMRWQELQRAGPRARVPGQGPSAKDRVNLDAVALDDVLFPLDVATSSEPHGGYTTSALSTGLAEDLPSIVREYVAVAPHALRGVHSYQTSRRKRTLPAEVVEQLWERSDPGEDELPFLTRVPFDEGLRRSGGSMPAPRLPKEMLLDGPEATRPPPERSRAARLEAADQQDAFAADEDLLARARPGGAVVGGRAAARPLAAAGVDGIPPLDEDTRFTKWSTRVAGVDLGKKTVSILDSSVDFGSLRDPGRLEKVGVLDAEAEVPVGRRRPLPQDAEFISTFRRPLADGAADDRDPLGLAAPDIDITELDEVVRSSVPDNSRKDSDYLDGGALKFPRLRFQKLPSAAATGSSAAASAGGAKKRDSGNGTQRLPPRLGRLRQARLEDLSDLLRPGGSSTAPAGSSAVGRVGRLPQPGGTGPEVTATEDGKLGSQENAALAAQQMLNKRLTSMTRQRFPSRKEVVLQAGDSSGTPRRSTGGRTGERRASR